jgi:hypothetical protein
VPSLCPRAVATQTVRGPARGLIARRPPVLVVVAGGASFPIFCCNGWLYWVRVTSAHITILYHVWTGRPDHMDGGIIMKSIIW